MALRRLVSFAVYAGFLVATLYLALSAALVYLATRPEARQPFEAFPAELGLQYEDVAFTSRGEEIHLRGWLLSGTPGAPYLVFVHGIDSQRTAARALELAAHLIRDSGYNVLLFDLRAHGASDGDLVTAGDRERYDVLGAYDFVVSRGAQPGRVGVIGRSYGAGIGIMAAAMEPGIAAVVADSPFSSVEAKAAHEVALRTPVPEWAVSVFKPAARVFADLLYDIDLDSLSPERDAARLAYPILVIHGEVDSRTPVSQGRRVYEEAPPGSELWTPAGVEHTDAFEDLPEEYLRRTTAYLASRLGQ